MSAKSERILVIDNGSYESRVGWSDASAPEIKFRNLLTRAKRDRKKETTAETEKNLTAVQVGNDITNIEAVRAQLKTQFDRNVVTHFYNQEQIFDYTFSKLGFDGQSNIAHPIVITEALANPNYSRQQMNELLFECYGIPALSYGIDALFSWQRNGFTQDSLIISLGYTTTHVIPMLNGELKANHVRRLNVGGYHIITFLFRLMQMKYPVHISAITISRMEAMVHQHCHIAVDYQEELMKWTRMEYYDQQVKKIQLPYNAAAVNSALTPEQKLERRRELSQRLMELNNRRAKERLQEDEEQLKLLYQIRDLFEQKKVNKFQSALQQNQISNIDELNKLTIAIETRVARIKEKATSSNTSKPKPQLPNIARPPANVTQEDWLEELRTKRELLLKRKHSRQAHRQEQAKRHTHAAQERMRIISRLARNEKDNDDFGMNDDDWDVYKHINRYNDDSDSDTEKLMEYENILRHYEPNFEEIQNNESTAESYQLHFAVETIRAPEILFQPSMIGSSETGLAELIAYVLKFFTAEEQQRMVDNTFITGGCGQFPGLLDRLHKELLEIRPFKSTFNISMAQSPMLDAWLGACNFTQSSAFEASLLTRKDFEENGPEYFKTHQASNYYFPTPKM